MDAALAAGPSIDAFLRQEVETVVPLDAAWAQLRAVVAASPVRATGALA